MPNRFLTHDAEKAKREPNVFITWDEHWKKVWAELKIKLQALPEKPESPKKG